MVADKSVAEILKFIQITIVTMVNTKNVFNKLNLLGFNLLHLKTV